MRKISGIKFRKRRRKIKKKKKLINIYIFNSLILIITGVICVLAIKLSLVNNNDSNYYIFNEKINKKYIKNQNDFCVLQNYNNYSSYINNITLVKANYNDISFYMYVLKGKDIVSSFIKRTQIWEKKQTTKLIEALDFYTKKFNIKNKEAYIIDIGANLGWYTLLFGKLGFNVLSFEPSNINYFILKKNYCLNKDINVTLINKGLFTEEKICDLYNQMGNEGNGFIYCDKNYTKPKEFSIKAGKMKLTKLQNFIPFLSNKNLIMIKIDTEGSEGKALEGGIEIITKYHVPFIFLEFNKHLLRAHGTRTIKFLQMFIENGYKICLDGFLSKKYISPNDKFFLRIEGVELYIVYENIFN